MTLSSGTKLVLFFFGNSRKGVDFHEIFTPVAKVMTIQTVFSIVSAQNWPIHQMDVYNAFLHGDLHEEVYIGPLLGFHYTNPTQVCRLKKSL